MTASTRVAGLAGVACLALVAALPATSASFTDTATADGSTIATGELAPIEPRADEIAPTSIDLAWDTAPAGGLTPEYTLTREGPEGIFPVYDGPATTITDNGNIPSGFEDIELTGVTSLEAGYDHTCAIADESIYCWGQNSSGQLGDGTTTQRSSPTVVRGVTGTPLQLSAGGSHTCALTSTDLFCWGSNEDGKLGDGTTDDRLRPVAITSGFDHLPTHISVATTHTCAIADDTVHCWGGNTNGQLGDDTLADRHLPAPVADLPGTPTHLASGQTHTCAIADDTVYCWGLNENGQLGGGTTGGHRNTPEPVADGIVGTPTHLASGWAHVCAIADDTVYCWGLNQDRQLGDERPRSLLSFPLPVGGEPLNAPTHLAAGFRHTCATTSDSVYCWGGNPNGQLGDDSITSSIHPHEVPGLSASPLHIAAGDFHSCTTTTETSCWGRNSYGQLGDGTFTGRFVPTAIDLSVVPICRPGASLLGYTDLCSLAAGTEYTYRLGYTIGNWTAPIGEATLETARTP